MIWAGNLSRGESGLDASLKGGGPFEAPHHTKECPASICSQKELSIGRGLGDTDVASAENFYEDIKRWRARGLQPRGPAITYVSVIPFDRDH